MTENLKSKSVLIIDTGTFTFLAERLARDFGKVYYHCSTWKSAFPTSDRAMLGRGIENVEVVKDYADYLDKADMVMFTDIYLGDVQTKLKASGKAVYGAGMGEKLERDRWLFLQTLKNHDLPVIKSVKLKGIDAIREHLKKTENKYIKGAEYRGDFESQHHINYKHTQMWLDDVISRVGARQNEMEMIISDTIDAVAELGVDTWIVNGKFPEKIGWGIEVKDEAYLSTFFNPPKQLKIINGKVSLMVKDSKYTGPFSNEVRITKEGSPHFIDFTARQPLPPSSTMCEWYSNFSQIVWDVAHGIVPVPSPIAKYGAELLITSEWLIEKRRWLAVDFPKEESRWFKPFYSCVLDGQRYIIPLDDNRRIGSVIGFGDTVDAAIESCLKRAEMVVAIGADYSAGSFDKAKKSIMKAKKIGIQF